MENQTPILSLINLDVGYNATPLLNAINLNANKGELLALMGLNGTGKTTLFKTILKETPSLSGKVLFGDKELELNQLQSQISVVYTERISIYGFSVTDMIAMGRMPHTNRFGKLTSKDQEVINASIKSLKLDDIAEHQIDNLSDGQFQKVMIARALAQETPLLLLDEPTAFLDIKNKKMIHELLVDLSQNHNKTILVSTHDITFCQLHCDKVWLVKDGELNEKLANEIKESDFD